MMPSGLQKSWKTSNEVMNSTKKSKHIRKLVTKLQKAVGVKAKFKKNEVCLWAFEFIKKI